MQNHNPKLVSSNGQRFFKRVLVASNTLPLVVSLEDDAEDYHVKVCHEPFPIESALDGIVGDGKEIQEYQWIGWPHCEIPEEKVEQVERVIRKEGGSRFHPIILDEKNINNYYKGYCKIGLWPLLHYQLNFVRLESEWWDSYVEVNQLFCNKIVELWQPGDVIWIHDYHLMLLPLMVRKALFAKVESKYHHQISIGFFFHAPFPSYELFRILPNRKEMLEGILGSNLIGFQSFEYLRHFKSSCARLLDMEADPKGIEVVGENVSHFVKLQVYPIGVDFSDFITHLNTTSVLDRIAKLREIFKGKRVIFARDRLDSIEGVPRKLSVVEGLLENHPEWREKLVLIQIYEPIMEQNSESEEKKTLHRTVNEMVGRINGKYGTLNSNPIEYINRKLDMEELTALYRLADIALVTPLRDGMNLTSHEYVVCQKDNYGVLVLSEFTGAARCLGGSIIVNPFSKEEITLAIIEALDMPIEDRKLKHSINYNYVMANTSHFWAKRYLSDLYETVKEDPNTTTVPQIDCNQVLQAYKHAKKRIFFLDYDGTLTPLVKHPKLAAPSQELMDTLEALTADPRNHVYVISGRDRSSLEGWLGKIPVGMSCEHGGLFRPPGHNQEWIENSKLDLSWKDTVTAIMQDFEDRTPGSFVEYKQINLTWHYRAADPDFSEFQAGELMAQLHSVANKYPLDILLGKKAIEVKPIGVNKGGIIKLILSKQTNLSNSNNNSPTINHLNNIQQQKLQTNGNVEEDDDDDDDDEVDFIFCCGDDKTDEDMFKELLQSHKGDNGCFSIKVLAEGGKDQLNTYATSLIESPQEVIQLLKSMSNCH